MLHPAAVVAVLVLVLNDHLLKHHFGDHPFKGVITGKLSDVAGLAFFPLALVALLEVARWVGHRRSKRRGPHRMGPQPGAARLPDARAPEAGARNARSREAWAPETWVATRREVTVAILVTGLGFAAIQLVPVAGDAYVGVVAVLRWLPAGLAAAVAGTPLPSLPGVAHVMDATDTLCLPALWVSHVVGGRARSGGDAGRAAQEGDGDGDGGR